MTIKMIVTDLDGSLLRDNKTISERSLSAILRCRELGIKTVFATGRGGSTLHIVPSHLFDGFVRNNGAHAYVGEDLLYSRILPVETVRELLVACNAAGIHVSAELDNIHFCNFDIPEEWMVDYKKVDFRTHDVDAEKILAIIESLDTVKLVKEHISADMHLYLSNDGYAMVMHKDATKSAAVSALAAYWNIEQDEIVSFGDDINDIDLLEYSGIGIAMGNALCEVKTAADHICDTNENDGIAKWLEANLLLIPMSSS